MGHKRTLYTPAEWESLIQCAFKINKVSLTVLSHEDIIDFKSPAAFPEFAAVYADKTAKDLTAEPKEKQLELNNQLGLEKRKPEKIYWSELVDIMFVKDEPQIMKFRYRYDEDYRSATFSSGRRSLRSKQQYQAMRKYSSPCGITVKKKKIF